MLKVFVRQGEKNWINVLYAVWKRDHCSIAVLYMHCTLATAQVE
jgi:hypothetical protein